MVDHRRGIHDQIDGVGQPLPRLLIQAEVRLAFVAGDDLQMLSGQFPVVPQQLGIAAVEGLVQALTSRCGVLAPHQADQLAVDEVHPFEPLQRQVTAEESGRAGQQDRAHLNTREWQRRRGRQCLCVDEFVQREITGVHLGGIRRPCTAA